MNRYRLVFSIFISHRITEDLLTVRASLSISPQANSHAVFLHCVTEHINKNLKHLYQVRKQNFYKVINNYVFS